MISPQTANAQINVPVRKPQIRKCLCYPVGNTAKKNKSPFCLKTVSKELYLVRQKLSLFTRIYLTFELENFKPIIVRKKKKLRIFEKF
jgi:hypothetical protein